MGDDPAELILGAAREVLGLRLEAFVRFGSSATGDLLAGYSDLDLLIGLRVPIALDDLLALQHAIAVIDPEPFGYFQPTFVVGRPSQPMLTPGTFQVLAGGIAEQNWVCGADDLRIKGEAWLTALPRILEQDAADWSMTTQEQRRRQARLHLTRVKPALRAVLVQTGCEPLEAWTGTWEDIANHLNSIDPPLAGRVELLLSSARRQDDQEVAEAALRVVASICTDYLDEDHSGGAVIRP